MLGSLKDKKILLGISGGIAAYKGADLVSRFIKEGAKVKVVMTNNALKFIQPLTLETLSGHPVYYDTFDKVGSWEIDHISLAKWADLVLIAPATANVIAKVNCGLADDLLSTTVLATKARIMIAPAMNTQMYENTVVQSNIKALIKKGTIIIPPAKGRLACGDWGEGKLADVDMIISTVKENFAVSDSLKGVKVLVTAGPTHEAIDPVRFISNPSSGKMGYAIAKACLQRGASVDLVTGPTFIEPPTGACVYPVESALDMYNQAMALYTDCSIVFMAAAVGDYRPMHTADQKLKKDSDHLMLELVLNPDILYQMGREKSRQILIGFAAETENLEAYAQTKMEKKNLDFILANDVTIQGAGFQSDTNQGLLICRDGQRVPIPTQDKYQFAGRLLDEVLSRVNLENK